MALFAIGDLQGCLDPLLALLEQLQFDPGRDRLLFTGDLVNRGPQSLETLRYVKSLGDAAVTVLGNHDLHLLAAALSGKLGRRDTLDALLGAPDREELLHWLRQQPLAYAEPDTGTLLIHAGLLPQWSRVQALQLAQEASETIAGGSGEAFLRKMYGNEPDTWDSRLKGTARLRCVVNAFTRLRYCTAEGRMDFQYKGTPGSQPKGLMPWFEVPGRRTAQDAIVCGHWSTLGRVHWPEHRLHGLDTGCVWGGSLTALDLHTGELHAQSCEQYRKPGAEMD